MIPLKKILNDTLIKENGKFDKQALTLFICFGLTVSLGVSNTIASYVLQLTDNRTAENIFDTFAMLTAALSGTNIANKYADIAKAKNQNNGNGQSYYSENTDTPP